MDCTPKNCSTNGLPTVNVNHTTPSSKIRQKFTIIISKIPISRRTGRHLLIFLFHLLVKERAYITNSIRYEMQMFVIIHFLRASMATYARIFHSDPYHARLSDKFAFRDRAAVDVTISSPNSF